MTKQFTSKIHPAQPATANHDSRLLKSVAGLVQLTALGAFTTDLLIGDLMLPWSVRILLMALLMLTIRRSLAAPVLIAFQLSLFLQEPPAANAEFSAASATWTVLLLMTLLLIISRFTTIQRTVSQSVWFLLQRMPGTNTENDLSSGELLTRSRRTAMTVIGRMTLLTAVVMVAGVCLWKLPGPHETRSWIDLTPEGTRMLRPGPSLLTAVAGLIILISEITWRQITRAQAEICLRTILVNSQFADLRMIVLQKQKVRRLRLRRSATDSGISLPNSASEKSRE